MRARFQSMYFDNMTRTEFASYKFSNWIFFLSGSAAAAAATAVRFGVFIRLNFDSISDHGWPCALVCVCLRICVHERASGRPRGTTTFYDLVEKKFYIVHRYIGASESNRARRNVSHSRTSSSNANVQWNRLCIFFIFVYIFSTFCHFGIAFDSFSIEVLLHFRWLVLEVRPMDVIPSSMVAHKKHFYIEKIAKVFKLSMHSLLCKTFERNQKRKRKENLSEDKQTLL